MNEKGKIPLPRKIRQAERRTRAVFMLGKELGGTERAFQRAHLGKT